MWVQPPRIESIFISFVSFSFNKRHVSVPTRTSIRAIGEIRVQKKYSCHSDYSCSKKSRVQAPSERPAANKDPCDPCAYKKTEKNPREKIFVLFWIITSLRSVGLRRISCSKDPVIKISSQ